VARDQPGPEQPDQPRPDIRAVPHLIAAISIFVTVAAPAAAQINPFVRYPMTHEDRQLIDAASMKLYKTDNPQTCRNGVSTFALWIS
jgi:hypothetical protein